MTHDILNKFTEIMQREIDTLAFQIHTMEQDAWPEDLAFGRGKIAGYHDAIGVLNCVCIELVNDMLEELAKEHEEKGS